MLDDAGWEAANAAHLGEALAWLRDRFERFAPAEATEPTGPSRARRLHPAPARHLPGDTSEDPPPALIALGRRLGLSTFELETLLLCAAMEFDTRTAASCARAHDDPQRAYPTLALALALFDDPAWEALSPERPLRHWRLIEVGPRATQPLTALPLRADDRIVNYLKGLDHLDERLLDTVTAVAPGPDDGELPPSQQAVAEAIFASLNDAPLETGSVVKLAGASGASACRVATEVAAAFGRRLFVASVDSFPRNAADLDALARIWKRETMLLPLALYVDARELDDAASGAVCRFVEKAAGLTFVAVADAGAPLRLGGDAFDVAKPTVEEQCALWETRLGPSGTPVARRLASQFDLDAASIAAIARRELAGPARDDVGARLWSACRRALRPALDGLAQRLELKATWDDLVLPPLACDVLHQIAARVVARHRVYVEWGYAAKMNRGLGITALFAGESGTGKTMSAEVIANELGLSLYRIDLSAVVSKYIGETEKNLRRVFDAADDGGAILFFDEADALFGKRSEVRDAHDRYANIEINYLLQRMEAFRGLAILATNRKASLDTAFTRRLRFIVNFPHPGAAERARMWERAIPAAALGEALDVARLARFNLTGAAIASAALSGAFLAARDGTKIETAHLLTAVRAEFIKADRPFDEADFTRGPRRGAA